jgi:hypothetical protein
MRDEDAVIVVNKTSKKDDHDVDKDATCKKSKMDQIRRMEKL